MDIAKISQDEIVYEKFIRRIKILSNGCWSIGQIGKYSRFRTTTKMKDSPIGGHR